MVGYCTHPGLAELAQPPARRPIGGPVPVTSCQGIYSEDMDFTIPTWTTRATALRGISLSDKVTI